MKNIKCSSMFLLIMMLVFGANIAQATATTPPASSCKIQTEMTNQQWYNISKGYYAAYDVGYGLTLAAIIIRESEGGLYKVNPTSQDFGLTHINIKTAIKRLGYKDTPFMRSVAASKIVADDDLAIRLAIEELLYWDKRRNGEWKHVVASYNSGTNMKNGLTSYYPKISKIVKRLRGCFEDQ